MKLPASVDLAAARFDALSMRERVLVVSALLAAVVMIWTLAILDPISGKLRALDAEKTALQEQIGTAKSSIDAATASDPTTLALAKEAQLKSQLDAINAQLANTSAGLIPPERMVQVIHDVLSRQHGVKLVSLHNKAVESLVKPAVPAANTIATTDEEAAEPVETAEAPPTPAISAGPFVHPVELVIEGSYLDVLAYLQALEHLDWRFYWKVLDLETTKYPINRVRIELSTLSMDKDWIGV